MKKSIYSVLIFLSMATIIFSQSMQISYPTYNTVIIKSDSLTIRWSIIGDITDNVKIRLFNREGTIKIKNIVSDIDNIGAYTCPPNFFNDVPDDSYRIILRTVNGIYSTRSGVFEIRTQETTGGSNTPPVFRLPGRKKIKTLGTNRKLTLSPPSIVITHPPGNHKWKLRLGNTALPFPIRVMWDKKGAGTQDRRVRILLQRRSPRLHRILIAQNTANSGLFRGSIPRSIKTNVYTIIIKTLDGKIRAESDDFFIINADDDPDTR